MFQFIFRFLIGGIVVSLFAVMGDVLKPKSFAGLYGAAPSVALATLGLTIFANGKQYASIEARSMIGGAFAFLVYAYVGMVLMKRFQVRASLATIPTLTIWALAAFGAWLIVLR